MSLPPRVAVILVNHQDYTRAYLADCYASLMAQTYPSDRFTVFIVNNGLPANEARFTERVASSARILQHPYNAGWGGGNNAALTVALREGFDHVVMFNLDATADPTWLAELMDAVKAHPEVHIFQSTILLSGTNRVNSVGNRTQFLGYGYCNGYGEELEAALRRADPMDYASGAAMLVRREVFERIGLFREAFFLYYDDMEFCWRARLAGFRVGLAGRSVCRHAYNFQARLERVYFFQRNRLLTLLTLERLGTLLLIAPALLVSEGVVGIYLIAKRRGGVLWSLLVYWARPQTWRLIRAWRRQVRSIRRIDDAEIVTRFAPCVVFAEVDSPVARRLQPLLRLYWNVVKRLIRW